MNFGTAIAFLTLVLLPSANAMPDTLGRPTWREVVSSSTPSPPPERLRTKQAALQKGAKLARMRGKYKANAVQLPQHWVRSEDPAHPKMRIPIDLEDAHSMNVMPENSFWKDHDSDVSCLARVRICSLCVHAGPLGIIAGDATIHANSENV